jgi:hypothetical protein
MFETPDELRYEVESLTDEVSNLNNLLRIQKDEIERIREALTAQEIAKVLHAHRHTKNVKVKGQGPDTVQHCSCGAALPDQGPVSGEDGQRIHRFDVHRAEVLAGIL